MPVRHRRNILSFYASNFLAGAYLATGTTVLFERQLGLSFSQIFTLDAIYMLMFILFEIPSGAFADLMGRKKTIVLGFVALILGSLATGSVTTFFGLFLSFFLWAFGFSLISGAAEAMLYDSLNDEALYHKVYGRGMSLSVIGLALAGVLGPLLYEQYFRLPYLLSAVPFLLALIATLFFKETAAKQKEPFSLRRHVAQMREGARVAFGNKYVLWSMGALSLVFAVAYTFTSSYQPYLVEIGFSVHQFIYILPLMFLIEAFGNASSEKLSARIGESISFWISILALGSSLLILGLFANKLVVPLLVLYGFLQGVLRPLLSTYANRHIDASHRATVISVQSMFSTITASALLFSFGFLTDRIGVIALAGVIGAMVLIIGGTLLLVKPKGT